MRCYKFRILSFIVSITLIVSLSVVSGFSKDVGKSYTSQDTLSGLWNTYNITAKEDQRIHWNVAVIGKGTIQVLFVKGRNVTLQSYYLRLYSCEESVKECAKTFAVGSKDGTEFTLVILSEESYNVTYWLSIRIEDISLAETILWYIVGFFIIFGGIIVTIVSIILKYKGKHSKEMVVSSYPCPVCKNTLQYIQTYNR